MSLLRGLVDAFDLISAKSDEVQDLIIKSRFNKLQESSFEAVIISDYKNDGTGNPGLAPDKESHFWYRIRSLDGSDDGRPSPFTAPKAIRESRLQLVINNHRTAYYQESQRSDAARNKPNHGEVWKCRYSKKNYNGPIILEHMVRKDYSETINFISDAEADKLNKTQGGTLLGSQTPPLIAEVNLSNLPDDLPFVNYQELARGLNPILGFIGDALSPEYRYSDYDCGGQAGFESDCSEKVKKEFDPNSNPVRNKTFKEIKSWQRKYKAPKPGTPSPGPSGVGRYHIVRTSINSLQSIAKLSDNSIFDVSVQDGFAAFIILKKNRILGGYMLGKHTDIENAAHELSKEWSIFPSQYSGDMDASYRKRNKSYYASVGYKSTIEAKECVKKLESWKNTFQSFLGKPGESGNQRHLLTR